MPSDSYIYQHGKNQHGFHKNYNITTILLQKNYNIINNLW